MSINTRRSPGGPNNRPTIGLHSQVRNRDNGVSCVTAAVLDSVGIATNGVGMLRWLGISVHPNWVLSLRHLIMILTMVVVVVVLLLLLHVSTKQPMVVAIIRSGPSQQRLRVRSGVPPMRCASAVVKADEWPPTQKPFPAEYYRNSMW